MSLAVPAGAQKIVHIGEAGAKAHTPSGPKGAPGVRLRKYGRMASHWRMRDARNKRFALKRNRFAAFALPDQTLFPPYYEAHRPWVQRPAMASRIEGGRTVAQGSPWRSHIDGGRTVEGGSVYASRMQGGRTVEGGSRWRSHIKGGKTVGQGSRWASAMPNWRFSGYAAPVRPEGIPYYRAARTARSPWSSRLY